MNGVEFAQKYGALAHAVQTGTAMMIELQDKQAMVGAISPTQPGHSPKMLRTGINMAMVEQSSLARLLLEKNVITEDEYRSALITGLEIEVQQFEDTISDLVGTKVKLG